jgi:hypothetical protein
MVDRDPGVPDLRPSRWRPAVGAALGVSAGLAYYWFFGCSSG